MVTTQLTKKTPRIDVHGAFVRRTDFSGAILRDADRSFADASGALFRGADFERARLVGTVLKAADLTFAKNLTLDQLASAIIDEKTLLPDYIDRDALAKIGESSRAKD